jgi:hypothetical protein
MAFELIRKTEHGPRSKKVWEPPVKWKKVTLCAVPDYPLGAVAGMCLGAPQVQGGLHPTLK